LSVRYYKKCAI